MVVARDKADRSLLIRSSDGRTPNVEQHTHQSLRSEMTTDSQGPSDVQQHGVENPSAPIVSSHDTLKYHLLGPSLTKAGQDTVDQQKVVAG